MTPTPRPPHSSEDILGPDGHLTEDHLVDLALTHGQHEADRRGDERQDHLAACGDCVDALESLLRAVDGAREAGAVALLDPPPRVWARIEAELDATTVEDGRSNDTVVPIRRRRERRATTSRHRPALGWLAAACAAGVLVGAGGFLAADRLRGPEVEPSRLVASAELDTLDTGARQGEATVSEQQGMVVLDVSTAALQAGQDGFIEVWLINRDGERLVSVGVLAEGARTGSFPISQRLLDEGYVVVDISREQFDDQPQHSGDSIVRGSLTTPA